MAPPWLDAAAARRRRVRLLLPIALGVLLSHLWLVERLADGLAGAQGARKAPARLQVAFVRELQLSDPPAPAAPAPDAPGAARTAPPRPDAPRPSARLQAPEGAASAAEAAARAAAERAAAEREAEKAAAEKAAAEKAAAEKAAAERLAAERAAEREARLARALAAVAAAEATGKATGAAPAPTGSAAGEAQVAAGAAASEDRIAAATAPGASSLDAASPAAPAGSAGAPAAIPGRPGGAAAAASPGAPVVGPPAAATLPGRSAAGSLDTSGSPTGATAATAGTAGTPFEWPPSTRISYRLVGFVRGLVEGSARVEWLREGERYQVHLDVLVGPSFAPIVQRHMSSDGAITAEGLAPRRYDEQTDVAFARGRSVSMAFDETGVTLGDGRRAPRLPGVQDTASQFVQMTYLFRAGARRLETGAQIEMPLALPKRVDRWVYDVVGEEPLETPFGTVPAWHLKPRRIGDPSTLSVEAWFAPGLQYLPARILIRDGRSEDNYIDLMIDRLPQQALAAPPTTAAPGASTPP